MPFPKFTPPAELIAPSPGERAHEDLEALAQEIVQHLERLKVGKVGIYVGGERARVMPWAGREALEAHARFFGKRGLTPEAVLTEALAKEVNRLGDTPPPGALSVGVWIAGRWVELAAWPR